MFLFILFITQLFLANCFIFSVIISIYNTGRYLDETIESLLNQTFGFSKIQIILVNDGSTDNTENICLKYKKLYINNIFYYKIQHSGVSKARNVGLKFAKGLYINFLDSDDKWDYKAFKYIYLFFFFYKNIDIVSGRMKYFETKSTYHFLDYKFKTSRVVNLTEDYSYIQLSSSSSFFRKKSIKDNKFEESIVIGEDTRFINNNLLKKPLLGIIREAIYYYRKRTDSTSAIQNTESNLYFYSSSLLKVQQYLIDKSNSLYNIILPFIQYFIAYDIIFRLKSKAYLYLNSINYKIYCNIIENLLKQIEDKYFLEQKIFPSKLLVFALTKKYNKDIRYDITLKNKSFMYSNYSLINLKKYKNIINWRIIEIKDNKLHLEGVDRFWMPKETYYYFCKFGNSIIFPKYYYYSGDDFVTMYGIINKGRIIVFDIIVNNNVKQNLCFFLSYKNVSIEIFPSLDLSVHIPPINNSYYVKNDYLIQNINNYLIISPYEKNMLNSLEQEYDKELKILKKEKIIQIREDYFETQSYNNKNDYQIWIINDRKWDACDNGEYFFRFLSKLKPKGIKFYFIIKKESRDYIRLKSFGKVIDLDSSDYLKLFIKADKIISSVSDAWVTNPFKEDSKYITDLYHFKFIYLQNGIIKDDLSKYLNKLLKNFDLIITSSKKEYNSFLSYNYRYDKKNIILTGLSRFDYLYQLKRNITRENLIIIAPTWRVYIKGTYDLLSYKSILSENFKKTDFFHTFNDLINDEKLLLFMKMNDYKGILCLHHKFEAEWRYFNRNDIFIIKEKCNIQELLVKSSLLITDYSSLFFDYAFLKKPIIYVHFDYHQYRSNHFQEGYFDYKTDGFGPICYNIKCVRETLISFIENKCKLKNVYLMKIKKFFKYFDENQNQRIYKKIIKESDLIKNDFSKKILYYIFLFIIIKIWKNY